MRTLLIPECPKRIVPHPPYIVSSYRGQNHRAILEFSLVRRIGTQLVPLEIFGLYLNKSSHVNAENQQTLETFYICLESYWLASCGVLGEGLTAVFFSLAFGFKEGSCLSFDCGIAFEMKIP
jgi:hypothetical protein